MGCVRASVVRDIERAIETAAQRCGVRVLRWAALSDHVHVLASYRPSTRLSDFVRLAKCGSSKNASDGAPGAVKWARGYFVRSLSGSELRVVTRYIARQHLRHPDRIPR
jgi:REP element-mobilizing transposase RayT